MEAASTGNAMRRWLLLLALLSGCRDDPQRHLVIAERLLRQERFDFALKHSEMALDLAQHSANPVAEWRARLLEAEILLANQRAGDGLRALGPQAPKDGYLDEQTRYFLLRSRAYYLQKN